MKGIAIYMEGGGNTAATKATLRQGMNVFLSEIKDSARAKSWNWKLVCCGGRDQAFKAFANARRNDEEEVIVLLVDSEAAVYSAPCAHLTGRDGWNLTGVPDNDVHLMAQTMETWIVADNTTLRTYYGQHFKKNALPRAINLETVEKVRVASALEQATRHAAPKKTYRKIHHGGELLSLINPQLVRKRCPNCERLFATLGQAVERA